jgi:ABC-2 type transport system permease protein
MRRVLTVIREEYRRHVLRKQFIGMLLAPLIIMAVSAAVGAIAAGAFDGPSSGAVGYVDPAGALSGVPLDADPDVTFRKFDDRAVAEAALKSGEIIQFYALAPDFATSGKAEAFYWKERPERSVDRALRDSIRAQLMRDVDAAARKRLTDGVETTYISADGRRNFGANGLSAFLLPLILAVLIIIALATGSQYLIQAVVDEKENRTIEVMVSTLTPFQLMAGKIIGLTAVVLTQVGSWVVGGVVAILALRDRFAFLRELSVTPEFVIGIIVLFVLQLVLYSAIMAAIGSMVSELKQAQSLSGPFILLAVSPEFFLPALFIDPNGVIAVALSLIPFTSPFTLAFRYGMTSVPIWQFAVAIVLMAAATWLAIRIASKIFRAGVLRYGQQMPLSEVFDAIRA